MRLESVRALKLELVSGPGPSGGLLPQQLPAVSVPAERLSDLGRVHPGIALGVAPGDRVGDFRLAVRIQHRDLLTGSRVEAIVRQARDEVDVQYVGVLSKQTGPSLDGLRTRVRPLHPGISLGHIDITAGTLGAIVRSRVDDRPRLLSNNHVLADENRGDPGDQVLQPGAIDGGRADLDRVATLERFVELHTDRTNFADAALALVDDGVDVDPMIPGLGHVTGLADVEQVLDVAKVGRTTGLRRGRVTAIEVDDVVVNFSAGLLRFDDQIEISGADGRPFSAGGDSGSLIVDTASGSGVGLLFAGSDQGGPDGVGVTYANPLGVVFDLLSISGLW